MYFLLTSLDSYSIQAYIHLTLSELIYMVYGFDSSSIGHFPAMVCSISAEGSLNLVAHWIYIFLLLPLSEPFLVYFVGI